MQKVLVLSHENDSRSFLSVVRSLGRKNITVHAVSNVMPSNAIHSKYIKKIIILPDFSKNNLIWSEQFIHLLKKENYTLVIPCDDPSAICLQQYNQEFSKYTKLYLLNTKTFDIVSNKYKTTRIASSLGINVPNNILVDEKYNLQDIIEQFSFPLVLKPISSYILNSTERNEVKIIYDKKTLIETLNSLTPIYPIQIQSFFRGTGVTISVLAKEGNIIIASQHKRMHEPFSGGGSSYRVSMLIDDELFEASKKLISKLNYTGVAMIEFRYNTKTKNWVLLEINGRFWGSLPLAISAGIDFPYLLFQVLTNKEAPPAKVNYKVNVYQRNLELDLYWLNDAIFNSSKAELFYNGYTYKSLFYESMRVLFFRDKIDTFSIVDPYPFFKEVLMILKYVYYTIAKKIRYKLLGNIYLRNHIRKRLLVKLTKAKNILFVCKGNICRSPFAHYVATSLWTKIPEIKSTGFYTKIDRNVPDVAQNCASQFSIDLSNHRSSVIDTESVINADLIFYFDEENRIQLYNMFAFYRDKMYPISLLSVDLPVTIEDPIDENEREFHNTYQNIYDLINNYK